MTDASVSVEAAGLQDKPPLPVLTEEFSITTPPSSATSSPISTTSDTPAGILDKHLEVAVLSEANQSEINASLFELCEQQKRQLQEYQDVIQRLEAANGVVLQNCKELEGKYELAVKQKENAIREKESMVVRYAVSEKSVLKQQTAKDAAEKRMRELQREHDLLQHKLTMMGNEKNRICQMLDNKCYELKSSQQETERYKTDLGALETKLKWSQTSLKNEIDLRKESDSKVEALQSQIQEYANEAEKARKQAEDSIREFHTSQDNRAHTLDIQNKEHQASLIMLRHELDDRDQQVKTLQSELEKLQKKHNDTIQENNHLSQKVQRLERERADVEVRIADLRSCADQQRQDAADLHSKNGQLEQLKLQLQSEQEHLNIANEQIDILRTRNADLTNDMEACRAHESELLAFTQQLTDKNVALQSEFSAMETKLQQQSYENGVLARSLQEATTKNGLSSAQMLAERRKLSAELESLQNELRDCRKQLETVTQELADQQGENSVIKRKHELQLREVTKELSHCRKRIEQHESQSTASSSSSTTSLNIVNGQSTPPIEAPAPVEQVKVIQPELELDRHVLIDHIAKLQRISAKKSEKIDFMEEHVRTLVGELQKKSRLLQHYIKREQQGTLSSNKMDNNKAALAKHSGMMASIYSAKIADENLSMEQVLDINRKLYTILEDALLKNITLKENIDTLGAEIEKLQKEKTAS